MTAFCAVCTADIVGEVRRAPLGRGGVLVVVCDACMDEPAREGRQLELGPAYRGSEPDQLGMSTATMRQKIRAASVAMGMPARPAIRQGEMLLDATAGWIVVRVDRRDARGEARDRRAALATLAGEVWARELRYLGMTARYVLFERPPRVKLGRHVAGRDTYAESDNPIAWLEEHAVSIERPAAAKDRRASSSSRPARKAKR